jgi:hypothetical protein
VAKTWGPFTGRQLTTIIVAVIVGAVLVPSSVWAVDAFSNVAIEDPVTGVKAQVDSTQHVKVGDGAGPLTVDGTVSARTASPSKVWSVVTSINQGYNVLAGPSLLPIELTSLSIFDNSPSQPQAVLVVWTYIPASATTCPHASSGTNYYVTPLLQGTPLVVTFPTPIQLVPQPGQKICLQAFSEATTSYVMNASGYYG